MSNTFVNPRAGFTLRQVDVKNFVDDNLDLYSVGLPSISLLNC